MNEIVKFEELSKDEKLKQIEEVLEKEIRPMIGSHGGNVALLDMNANNEVLITYQGACAGCMASTSSTLVFIEETLQAKVHPDLTVTPIF